MIFLFMIIFFLLFSQEKKRKKMTQGKFVGKLNFLWSNINHVENFLIFSAQKSDEEFCKIFNKKLKEFLSR